MSLTVGIGFNDGEDAYTVGANACQDAFDRLKDSHADLVIVFSSVLYDQEKMLEGVRSVSKDTLLVGASTSGEITAAGPLIRHSVVVMLIKSDTVRFFVGVGEGIEKDPHVAGKSAADAVRRQTSEEFSMFMMFPDVLAGNGAATVRGVQDSLGPNIPIVGGAAGDDFRFEKTYQYLNDKVYSGAVVGVGFVGNCTWGIGVKHGWIPVGIPKKVTRSEGSIVHELDGKPAISIYDEYFGEEEAKQLRAEKLAKLAITYPLGMRIEGSDEMLIRDPLTVDENGAMTCTAEIPVGTEVNLMVGSREEAEQVSRIAAKSAIDQLHGADPKVAFIFNCIARSKLFGERAGEEISMIQECVGTRIPLIGFYTYGEIAPLKGDTRRETCNSIFHNETVVICLLAG
jgi:hypothetical protein